MVGMSHSLLRNVLSILHRQIGLYVVIAGMLGALLLPFIAHAAPKPTLENRRILRLFVVGAGEKRSEYSIFVSVAERNVKHIGHKARQMYCFQHTRSDSKNWRFFAPCGKIIPLYEDTYQLRDFPTNLGKIEEVLSGRVLRYSKAMRLAVSDLVVSPEISASPLSARGAVQSYLDNSGVFIGMSILRHGSMR